MGGKKLKKFSMLGHMATWLLNRFTWDLKSSLKWENMTIKRNIFCRIFDAPRSFFMATLQIKKIIRGRGDLQTNAWTSTKNLSHRSMRKSPTIAHILGTFWAFRNATARDISSRNCWGFCCGNCCCCCWGTCT